MSHWLYELARSVLSAKPATAQREWLSARLARIDGMPLKPSIHDSNGERPEDAVAAALDPAMKSAHPEIYDIALDIVGTAIEALNHYVLQISRGASTAGAPDLKIEAGLIALQVANAARCEDLRTHLFSVAQAAKNADGEIRRVFVAATRGLNALEKSADDLAFWLDATTVRETEVLAFRALAAFAPRDALTVRALLRFRARMTGAENEVRLASVNGFFAGKEDLPVAKNAIAASWPRSGGYTMIASSCRSFDERIVRNPRSFDSTIFVQTNPHRLQKIGEAAA